MRRAPTLLMILSSLAVALCLFACESQPDYATCELDEEVTNQGICAGKGTGAESCVVEQHPHCPEISGKSACLSYFDSPAFCSRGCQVDSDCPGQDACCWEFSDTAKYCVPAPLAVCAH